MPTLIFDNQGTCPFPPILPRLEKNAIQGFAALKKQEKGVIIF